VRSYRPRLRYSSAIGAMMRSGMLDHTGIAVSDLNKSRAFYIKALGPLSISLVMEVTAEQTGDGAHAGFGKDGKPFFWIGSGGRPSGPAHFAFTAKSRDEVVAFHRAALAAGGKDNGPPGLRPHYHANYYGAFVVDPDGNNIEAVCHNAT
jgi:catechol 2,3-dioxygenase-like lactoylglutathione lyase family enzyme